MRVPNPNVLVGQKYTGPLGLYSAEVQMGLSGFELSGQTARTRRDGCFLFLKEKRWNPGL